VDSTANDDDDDSIIDDGDDDDDHDHVGTRADDEVEVIEVVEGE